VYGVSFSDMINIGYIVLKMAKSLCGSIGMVLTIPIAAIIATRLIAISYTPPAEVQEGQKEISP